MRASILLALVAVLVVPLLNADPAQAQATRTWVSGVGDDANPCSRTAPCKTFAGAISKTFINGEINCLDPAGYGTVTITKSITIDCEDTQGSILASGTNGVNINIAPGNPNDPLRSVRLRGLSINGAGASGAIGTATGLTAINIISADKVFIDEVFIQNFANTGILWNGPGGHLSVRDSLIMNIIGGPAIRTLSTVAGAAGIVHVAITRTTTNSSQQGIRLEGNSFGVVSKSTAANHSLNGIVVFPQSIGGAELTVVDTEVNNNLQFGVFAGGSGQTGIVRLANATVIHNGVNQLQINAGGQILSNGKNHIGVPTMAPGGFTDQ